MKRLLLSLLFIYISKFTFAAYDITGKVVDAQTKLPLAGAVLSIPDLRASAIASTDGSFNFRSVPTRGKFLLVIKLLGYETLTQQVDLSLVNMLNIELKPSLIEAKEVVVTGSAYSADNARNSVSVASINKDDLTSRGATNIVDAISKVPGVSQ